MIRLKHIHMQLSGLNYVVQHWINSYGFLPMQFLCSCMFINIFRRLSSQRGCSDFEVQVSQQPADTSQPTPTSQTVHTYCLDVHQTILTLVASVKGTSGLRVFYIVFQECMPALWVSILKNEFMLLKLLFALFLTGHFFLW